MKKGQRIIVDEHYQSKMTSAHRVLTIAKPIVELLTKHGAKPPTIDLVWKILEAPEPKDGAFMEAIAEMKTGIPGIQLNISKEEEREIRIGMHNSSRPFTRKLKAFARIDFFGVKDGNIYMTDTAMESIKEESTVEVSKEHEQKYQWLDSLRKLVEHKPSCMTWTLSTSPGLIEKDGKLYVNQQAILSGQV